MKIYGLVIACLFAVPVLLGGNAWADNLTKARIVTGYQAADNPKWDPMNDDDRQYVGPTLAASSEWFRQESGIPDDVGSEKELRQLVYAMAYNLEASRTIKTSCGVNEKLLNKWARRINTSIYGQVAVDVKEDEVIIQVSHTPESRIMAAFRNPAMKGSLAGKEKEVLETCAQWIAENITIGMPNGLKLKKIHDALIDNSKYTKGHHRTADLILEGKGVCSAYTSAAQLLLHMVKIDCLRVMGTQKMNHVWNYVNLDNEWYHMDMTWDDPNGDTDLRMYNYYLLTDDEIASDHEWDDRELYVPTPKLNPWHFHARNDMQRSWRYAGTGYSLPKENESVAQSMYNTHLEDAAARGEQFANLLGKDVQRKEKAEDKLKMGEGSDPADVAKRWTRYAPKIKKLRNEDEGISNYREFNEKLEAFANELADENLVIQCKKNLQGWKLREIVGKSDINAYAEKYSVVYDEEKCTITLNIEYWTHVRVLTAAGNEDVVKKLTPGERRALAFCRQRADAIPEGSLKRKRQVIKDLHLDLVLHAKPDNSEPAGLCEFARDRKSRGLGYAQAMYVILNMSEIPCIMVHGRAKVSCCNYHDHVWNLVRINRREWYHADAGFDDELENTGAQGIKYCLLRDDEIKGNHSWDVEEIPATPTKEEKEALKKMNPFTFGR